MKAKRRHNKAFTLIEVLLVLLILGMLAGVAIVAFSGVQDDAKKDTTKLKLKQIESALNRFSMKVGRLPTETEGLAVLVSSSGLEDEKAKEKWGSPYLKETPKDAWDNEFMYEPVTEGASDVPEGTKFKIWSKGPDGDDGTEDDIKSWKSPDEAL